MSVPSASRPTPAAPLRSCPSAPPRWLTALILAAATLAFLPTLGGGFLGDDFVYIARFRELPWSAWPPLFTHDWSGGVWGSQLRELRPFAALSFMSDAKLFGGWAPGYQLTNLLLHLAATALVTLLAWRYTAGHVGAVFTAGLVFALHPAHAEAIIWPTGRVDLLATAAALLFWFGAEQFSDHGRPRCAALTLAAFFLGIFSKELVMFAPLLLVLHWLLLDLRAPRTVWLRRAKLFAGVLVIFAVYATARRLAFGHDNIGYNLWTDAPAWNRQAAHFGWLLPLLPFTGRAEWSATPPLATLHAIWLSLAAFTVIGLTVALLRRARLLAAIFFFGGVWYFITVFPLTGVVYFSPRHLYFPTVGLALAAGLLVAALRHPGARTLFATACIAWCAAALLPAIRPWNAAASVSRQVLATLDTHLATAPAGTLAVTHVPDTLGPVWLWAWSSPQCYGAPFLAHALPASRIIERPVNYTHSDKWVTDRKPVETLRAAPAAVAVYVSAEGEITSRVASRAELTAAAAKLAALGLSNETWELTVKSLAQPPR
jgi:hypothetical protein